MLRCVGRCGRAHAAGALVAAAARQPVSARLGWSVVAEQLRTHGIAEELRRGNVLGAEISVGHDQHDRLAERWLISVTPAPEARGAPFS